MPRPKQYLKSQRQSAKRRPAKLAKNGELVGYIGQASQSPYSASDLKKIGDAQKSARFFARALNDYDDGLNKFPASFDLAYNKPGDLLALLRTALVSHRYALEISQENADLLFNTGQVLTSLAELISEGPPEHTDAPHADPLQLYQEALEFFQRCLSLQEYQLTQADAEANASATGPMDVEKRDVEVGEGKISEPNQSAPSDEDHWATIVEPVTPNSLLDSLLVQVETLTSVCGLLSARGTDDPGWVEQYYQSLLHERISLAAKETGRYRESALTKAKFRCALAEAGFSTARLDISTYERGIVAAYEDLVDFSVDAEALCDRADAELAFHVTFRKSLQRGSIGTMQESRAASSVIRWKHLTKALDSFTTASKLVNAKNLPRIHLRRGDCEMHRRSLGFAPSAYDIAAKSATTLLKNAEIFYRGAAKVATAEAAKDEEAEALFKEAVVAGLLGKMSKLQEKASGEKARVHEIVGDMVEEGMLSMDDAQKLII
ncbi:MAG: hypothetical protein LQ345_004192 [Seirophora villosa]|nr:MAG: hypothetical protein LQ345_004192 [Seirophora villosa]